MRTRAALDSVLQAGIQLQDRRQHLGRTVGARYCEGGSTAQGLAVSVCDFGSEEAATRGVEAIRKVFPEMKNREVLQSGGLTVTLVGSRSPPREDTEGKTLIATFERR